MRLGICINILDLPKAEKAGFDFIKPHKTPDSCLEI